MWRFLSGSSGAPHGGEHLFSLNDFKGRQTWEFDPKAGTPEQRAKVEELRAAFTANRHTQKHRCEQLWVVVAVRCWMEVSLPPFFSLHPPSSPKSNTPPPQSTPPSSDELLRLQAADRVAAKGAAPPSDPLPEGEPVTAERVEAHLKVGGLTGV
jgi:cycloartenol synthase